MMGFQQYMGNASQHLLRMMKEPSKQYQQSKGSSLGKNENKWVAQCAWTLIFFHPLSGQSFHGSQTDQTFRPPTIVTWGTMSFQGKIQIPQKVDLESAMTNIIVLLVLTSSSNDALRGIDSEGRSGAGDGADIESETENFSFYEEGF